MDMLSWIKGLFRGAQFDLSIREETWRFDPSLERSGDEQDLKVAIHPAMVPRIVIMMPGYRGSLDGYEQKYKKIARLLTKRGVGAVVRSENPVIAGYSFETTCRTVLRGVTEGARARARAICGHPSPALLLLGWSAGASVMVALASDLGAESVLLMAPSGDANEVAIREGLQRFKGDLFVVYGEEDEVVGELPRQLFDYAMATRSKQLVALPGCDHQLFRGERNGRIMSHAPLWAFAGEEGFPDPARGIHLYD